MLYGTESISHYTLGNVTIWMSMAFHAGMLNVGAFMACHRFASHVTGFATHFGYEVNQLQPNRAYGMLLVPLFFLFGCMISGQLVDIRLKLHKRPKYYITFGIIFFLNAIVLILGLIGYFGQFGEPLTGDRDYVLLIMLSLICGIQNGTITSVSKSVIRTTHLTGITTDFVIGIVRFLNRHKLKSEINDEVRANLMRAGIIFFFIFGSVFGGFVFERWHFLGFAFPTITAGALFYVMVYFQIIRSSGPHRTLLPNHGKV